MITLTIPELPPSLNQTLRLGHWTKHARHRKHWSMLVLVAKSEAKVFERQTIQKARVLIQRYGGKTLDQDNAIGGCKALVDGLRDNGLIIDDTPAHMELRLEQHPGSRIAKRTVITIEAA